MTVLRTMWGKGVVVRIRARHVFVLGTVFANLLLVAPPRALALDPDRAVIPALAHLTETIVDRTRQSRHLLRFRFRRSESSLGRLRLRTVVGYSDTLREDRRLLVFCRARAIRRLARGAAIVVTVRTADQTRLAASSCCWAYPRLTVEERGVSPCNPYWSPQL